MRVRDDYESRGHNLVLNHGRAQCVLTRKGCAVARSRKCILRTLTVAFSELRLTGRENATHQKKIFDGGQRSRISS